MVDMPESRPYHHGDLRAALLAAAERTLRDKGVGSLSLRELAREVGVSHAAPGRHFKDKQALLQSGPPWFTTPHFDGYDYVLVRERDLGTLDLVELAEVVTDAWASRAPRTLVKEHLG